MVYQLSHAESHSDNKQAAFKKFAASSWRNVLSEFRGFENGIYLHLFCYVRTEMVISRRIIVSEYNGVAVVTKELSMYSNDQPSTSFTCDVSTPPTLLLTRCAAIGNPIHSAS